MSYVAPLRDIRFALEIAGLTDLSRTAKFSESDRDTVDAVLEAAGSFASAVLAPLNRIGDIEGARFASGVVTAPSGFKDAYRQYIEGGWPALSADAAFGGQGLPRLVDVAVCEMVHASNMAFGLCPMLTRGAVEALAAHGTPRQKSVYLPKLVSGEWSGTMNLTESQSGSDLSTVRTRAEPDGKGGYRLTGTKIFITWGDHDMAENIVHLVLARLPDAPEGTRGISLFLAPKYLVGDDGACGAANRLGPQGIEKKLGIHGSPTCTMAFDGAQAELIGEPHQGLALMFTMMNAARLQVGTEGVAIAERAYQQALNYSLLRRQGRSAWTGEPSAPIFDHPDIRRMLMLMKAKIEAARAICYATAAASDLADVAETEAARKAAKLREEFLTPIAKAWSTDVGVEVASIALQVHGGAGYIEETGAAQHYRDARIAPIYEGTNGIQAIDLVGRKLALESGAAIGELLGEIRSSIAPLKSYQDSRLQTIGARLELAVDAAQTASTWMTERRGRPDALAGATTYLRLMGDLAGGYMLAKGALIAANHAGTNADEDSWWQSRIGLARIFSDNVLAQGLAMIVAITAGAGDLERTSARALGAP